MERKQVIALRPRARAAVARAARAAVGMTQRAFAELIGTSYVSVARWEASPEHPPAPIALALLKLIAAEPEAATRVLGTAKRGSRSRRLARQGAKAGRSSR